MDAGTALDLLGALAAQGVDACVGGGWGVDALLGEQTRPHGDLDLWIQATAFDRAELALVRAGVDRLFPWGNDRPWNFVLHDGGARRIDLHLYEALGDGRLHYGGIDSGDVFPAVALDGRGTIAGVPVRCETPEWSVRGHTGYAPRPDDHHDVGRLCARFGIERPAGFTSPGGPP